LARFRARRFDVTQQRISVLLCFSLLAATACGGGDGAPSDQADPDAPPAVSDKQPPVVAGQNPVNPSSVPPNNTQPPPGAAGTPPTTGGQSCIDFCNRLPERGCQLPEDGCDAACRPDPMQSCARESIAFLICASDVVCPEEISMGLEQAAAHCPEQYNAYRTCLASSAGSN
jgi:hypothetical protein